MRAGGLRGAVSDRDLAALGRLARVATSLVWATA